MIVHSFEFIPGEPRARYVYCLGGSVARTWNKGVAVYEGVWLINFKIDKIPCAGPITCSLDVETILFTEEVTKIQASADLKSAAALRLQVWVWREAVNDRC